MRSIWKGCFCHPKILKLNQEKVGFQRKIWLRNSVIPEHLIGKIIYIHNGKLFKPLVITREKIGFKFGEFSYTRKFTKINKSNLKNVISKKKSTNSIKK